MARPDTAEQLALLRRGARSYLQIDESASEEAVRHECLRRLEQEDFAVDDEIRGAIQLLCGDSLSPGDVLREAPEVALRGERLVRRSLEAVAVRLRTESGVTVRPDLDRLEGIAELFPATREWHDRLRRLTETEVPYDRMTPLQKQLVVALIDSATTWPADAPEVRRRHLTEMSSVWPQLILAVREIREEWPEIAEFDFLLMSAPIEPVFALAPIPKGADSAQPADLRWMWGAVPPAVLALLAFLFPLEDGSKGQTSVLQQYRAWSSLGPSQGSWEPRRPINPSRNPFGASPALPHPLPSLAGEPSVSLSPGGPR